jgi:TIR domain
MSLDVFLSYSGKDSFEASLLQFALEQMLSDLGIRIWTYERDQAKSERQIGKSLKLRVQSSAAVVFLASPSTFDSGAAQWMELAYADAFEIPIFVLLHHMTFKTLKGMEDGVPPLLLEGQCSPASEWRVVVSEIKERLIDQTRSRR